jgi:hypothetical protein
VVHSFHFLVSIVIWYDILREINIVSKLMQSPEMQIDVAVALLKSTKDYMTDYRQTGFEKAVVVASDIASTFDDPVDSNFEIDKRIRKKKRQFDYEGRDDPVIEAKQKFKCEYFNVIVDQAIQKLEERFEQMVTFNDRYGFVHQVVSGIALETRDLEKKCADAAIHFEGDIAGDELMTEIISFHGLYKTDIPYTDPTCTASALSVLKYMYHNRLHEIYPNLNILLRMFLTVPVTVASGERSFSKLKIIKNYLRSSMAQDRLSGLALISVEHEI